MAAAWASQVLEPLEQEVGLPYLDFELDSLWDGEDYGSTTENSGHIINSQCAQSSDVFNGYLGKLQSLCLHAARAEVLSTSSLLNIPHNPAQWTTKHVRTWISWLVSEGKVQGSLQTSADPVMKMNGSELVAYFEDRHKPTLQDHGSSMASHISARTFVEMVAVNLEIWMSGISSGIDAGNGQELKSAKLEENLPPLSSKLFPTDDLESTPIQTGGSADTESSAEGEIEACSWLTPVQTATQTKRGHGLLRKTQSTSHIHLWQFLRELLADPRHQTTIRWLDRRRKIFKIENSNMVATLWGRRKNRPAMNYDKLARSIRQYYRKGIMKKTEHSQRLVYQFCAI